MTNPEEFKKGTIWKKTFKPDDGYIIFKIVDSKNRAEAKVIVYKDSKYSANIGTIVLPPFSDESVHEFTKLTEAELFLELL